jgi:flagellar protein FliO/FliZ
MDAVSMLGRMMLGLAVVLGVMWVLARRFKGRAGGTGKVLDVLTRQQLSKTASVAVVRVQDRALIVGITDAQVSVLGETDLVAFQASLEETKPGKPAKPGKQAAQRSAPARTRQARTPQPREAKPVADNGIAVPKGMIIPDELLVGAAPRATRQPATVGVAGVPADTADAERTGALSGSALSLDTWRQTVASLRELTTRR